MSYECACDFDGYAEFYSAEVRKARKAHKCGECGAGIESGDLYEASCQKFEGDFNSYKTCMACVQAARFYSQNNCGCSHPYGDLGSALEDMGEAKDAGNGVKFRAYRLSILLRRRAHSAYEARTGARA